jgi:RNA polymerase sporulation-specific sigma factor
MRGAIVVATVEELILNNQGLVYHIVHKFKPSLSYYKASFEDAVGEGMIGLVKAANKFDPERGFAFATFASMCITNDILMYFRKLKRHSVHHVLSLDCPLENDKGDEMYIEVADPLNHFEQSEQRVVFDGIADRLRSADVELVMRFYAGVPQRELAVVYGCTQSYISHRIKRTVRKAQQLVAR